MTGKTISGADFKEFYSDPQVWDHKGKPGWYVDDFLIRVDGNKDVSMDDLHDRFGEALEKLPDDASITIESGFLAWQGSGQEPVGQETDLQGRFEQWLAARTEVTVVATLRMPRNDHEAVARISKALDDLGAKVVRSDDPQSPGTQDASAPKP